MIANDDKDAAFLARIRSGSQTVEAWDADSSLLAECRLMIPFEQLQPELKGNQNLLGEALDSPYQRDDDFLYEGNALFLKRLTLFFQKDVMTWVNQPKCQQCGAKDKMEHTDTRGPATEEEREGQANRVEVYKCEHCGGHTTFPRYNSVRKLLETRQGRCGEYANLFGLYCRASGFETRYVSDWTDHVWIEVLVGDEWIMADSCEGIINKPSMYESGWGKKLSYIVGICKDEVVDVTPRYTRKFLEQEFQERRRSITSSEVAGQQIILQYNRTLRKDHSKARVEELQRRETFEQSDLDSIKSKTEWTEEEKHGRGRISGSLEWKIARNEAGEGKRKSFETGTNRRLFVEQFYPCGNLEISVLPRLRAGILVCDANCDIGQPGNVSIVVIDDVNLGCILQSRSYTSWACVADFVVTIPANRIVVLKGKTSNEELDLDSKRKLGVLGGFNIPANLEDGVLFMGQVEAHPAWTVCSTFRESSDGWSVEFTSKGERPQALRTESKTVAHHISTRLPESFMPLRTQLLATEKQKHASFLSFVKDNPAVIGYTTKPGCPVYLLDNSSFPFHETSGEWKTFHFLPSVLASDTDEVAKPVEIDIPVDQAFFASLCGPSLDTEAGNRVPIEQALRNTRLVGLYFSGHWCGPCRRFTPMLIEVYNHLREEFPIHGLEIVFVSSDRSIPEFNQYFTTMPWAAVPYDGSRMPQQEISVRYGVRGIPALVILDSMSGQIVASVDQARTEVTLACQRGDDGIEDMFKNWLSRAPEESQELFSMLQVSCVDNEEGETTSSFDHPYLIRNDSAQEPTETSPPFDPASQVKEKFAELVAKGEAPNAAAAKAIKLVSEMVNPSGDIKRYGKGSLSDIGKMRPANIKNFDTDHWISKVKGLNGNDETVPVTVLTTISKYVENAVRDPWNPKFRNFKLSNKVVDRVTRIPGGLNLILSFGMNLTSTNQDYMLSIPLAVDLAQMHRSLEEAIAKLTV
jgi:peptide-N4-(N-acetyl-beta-glucosaminyl)asparagine amidase